MVLGQDGHQLVEWEKGDEKCRQLKRRNKLKIVMAFLNHAQQNLMLNDETNFVCFHFNF